MTRFLFATWPFPGDVYPQVSIAQAVRGRGHSVAFYTGSRMRALLEGEGFACFSFEQVNEEQVCDLITSLENRVVGWQAPGYFVGVLRQWLIDTVPDQVSDLQSVIATWRPDVIVTSPFMYAPFLILWETLRIPVAISSTLLFCLVPGPDAPAFGPGLPSPHDWRTRSLTRAVAGVTDLLVGSQRRQINRIRARYNLSALTCTVNAFTARLPLYMIPSVRELDYQRHDLPPSIHYIGACLWNRADQFPPPAWLHELPSDRPWVHATEGTLHYQDPFVLRATAQGLAGLPLQVILTTGTHRRPESLNLGPPAANVQVEQWVSHHDLVPRCAVVITTGGAGTIMTALHVGVPLIVVPTHWDKPDNAQRIVEAGVGLRLAPKQCTPRRLRAAVERILGDSSFRTNAQRIAHSLAGERGPERAAELLEGVARRSPAAALH